MKKIISLVALFTILWPQLPTLNSQLPALRAQTIKVVGKQGQTTVYDVSKMDSISFQSATPGFTVYTNDSTAQYTFDKVSSISSSGDYLFAHPDTISVNGNTGTFAFQLNTNVDYDLEPSAAWIRYDGKITGTDSLRFIFTNNPLMTEREGRVVFVNKADDKMRDTLIVVQAGKNDTHFIDIDWATTTLNSFNESTGQCVLTFQGEVPEMGQYDAFLLPTADSYCIRLVNNATQTPGSKTVTLATREGKMGNLFRNKSFTLCSDPNYNPNSPGARAMMQEAGIAADADIIYPEVIELCADGKPIGEVYNRRAPRRATELQKDFNIYELNYDKSGDAIWESGMHSISWEKCTFDVGLKGVFYFNFGDTEWEKVRFGDLQALRAYLEGSFNTELILKYALSKSAEFSYEKTLKEDLFSYRVKFMVGAIPVWINISSDLKASVEASAEGTVTVTSGVTANANVKAGLQWDKVNGVSPIHEFSYDYNIVEPEVEAEAHAEAKAYVWPEIKIGIYDVLCPTINPKPYIRAYADARTAEANKPYFGWNAGVSTGVDLTLGLSLDLYFWEKEIGEIEPINLVDYDLVELPYRIERTGDEVRGMMQGDTCHVAYQVWGRNRITNSDYRMPGALLHLEKTGGGTITSDQMVDQDGEFYRTNADGEILLVFTQNDTIPATVNATLVTGDEERDKETQEWRTVIKNYRLTAPDVDVTNSVTARSSGTADIRYLLEEYTKSKEDENGRWQGLNGVNVTFKATGGSLKTNPVTSENGGYATAQFDGGGSYDGNGTLEASAYIEAFDTTVVAHAIKIDQFKFDDENLNRCYNLADNTALYKGEKYDVAILSKSYNVLMDNHGTTFVRDWVNCSYELQKTSGLPTENYQYTDTVMAGGYVGDTWYWGITIEKYTINKRVTKRKVICYNFQLENDPVDYVSNSEGYWGYVKDRDDYTIDPYTVHCKKILYDHEDENKIVKTETWTNEGEYSGDFEGSYRDWPVTNNGLELDNQYYRGAAGFEENGNIVRLFYLVNQTNPEYSMYVKVVFDKEGNTVYE